MLLFVSPHSVVIAFFVVISYTENTGSCQSQVFMNRGFYMENFFTSLTPSDYVQLLGIIASLITSIVAISISLITARQNSKMIENASRPVISIYGESINPGSPEFFIVIKNFGASPAHITQFDYDCDFSSMYLRNTGVDYLN